ncbi:MAG: cysteine--1-D-myo-inosityl 2-amino-2-deoxy-alpha-D-glucopyranoside ligase [Acidimicrobiales bacterium]|nr:MAG: cysteine--1-D-myo-inosityl 2-amino-2-deoxy-alpha-D-glucopyranoside ligase [Acidimicrobiales bacterium]
MDSWPSPPLPALPAPTSPEPLKLFDSASQQLRVAGPQLPDPDNPARMYVCGITPYDAAHLGHIATYLTFDLVQRYWRDAGHTVRYVQNVTDIDDPLLKRANRDNEDWAQLAHRETRRFAADMAALSVIPPESYIGVVESMSDVVETVDKLLADGAAYRVPDGTNDIYFDLASAPDFGYESGLDETQMLALFTERGGDPNRDGKRGPLDPLLWRGARVGEPSWPSPMGPGRPGWHIECSVIAVKHLGMQIHVQGGGEDLLFPHHEMSAAHAEVAADAAPFARTYVHAGLVGWEGEKMSKSKGNLVFASRLISDGNDPSAVRLALFGRHYRGYREWESKDLALAEQRLNRWRAAAASPAVDSVAVAPLLAELRSRLADDLDTPGALRAVDLWADAVMVALIPGDTSEPQPSMVAASAIDALLGVR